MAQKIVWFFDSSWAGPVCPLGAAPTHMVLAQAAGTPRRSAQPRGVRACVQQAQGTGGVCMTSEGCVRDKREVMLFTRL